MNLTPNERLLSVRECAELLGKHPDSVRRLINAGTLTAYKIPSGHGYRIPLKAVLDLLQPVEGGDDLGTFQ